MRYTVIAQTDDKLEFSFIGLESVKRKVDPSGIIDVKMSLGKDQALKEVEVLAVVYAAQKKEAITGARYRHSMC
ncbi:MAG: hypothetical protein ACMUEM_07580 [Flavobacteriales bacterium AspAUS03]